MLGTWTLRIKQALRDIGSYSCPTESKGVRRLVDRGFLVVLLITKDMISVGSYHKALYRIRFWRLPTKKMVLVVEGTHHLLPLVRVQRLNVPLFDTSRT